jgi:hypothetical protein
MLVMQDELDKSLQSLFQGESQNLPEEPFLTNIIRLIQKQHSRRVFEQRLILVLGLACCALLSRFVIKLATQLSSHLDSIIRAAGDVLDKPAGMLTAAICCTLLLFLFRRKLICALR